MGCVTDQRIQLLRFRGNQSMGVQRDLASERPKEKFFHSPRSTRSPRPRIEIRMAIEMQRSQCLKQGW